MSGRGRISKINKESCQLAYRVRGRTDVCLSWIITVWLGGKIRSSEWIARSGHDVGREGEKGANSGRSKEGKELL
jgi:hypothetical protein